MDERNGPFTPCGAISKCMSQTWRHQRGIKGIDILLNLIKRGRREGLYGVRGVEKENNTFVVILIVL